MFDITRFLAGTILFLIFAGVAHAAGCKEPDASSGKSVMFSPPLSEVVTGTGRLQFYSAPDKACAMRGVFIMPKDQVIAYADTDDGWTSVMYTNPRTDNVVQGWVRSARLKSTGTVGPSQ